MKITRFDIGINKKYAPQLLGKQFCVESINVDQTNGELKGVKTHKNINGEYYSPNSVAFSRDGREVYNIDPEAIPNRFQVSGNVLYHLDGNNKLNITTDVDSFIVPDLAPPDITSQTNSIHFGFPYPDLVDGVDYSMAEIPPDANVIAPLKPFSRLEGFLAQDGQVISNNGRLTLKPPFQKVAEIDFTGSNSDFVFSFTRQNYNSYSGYLYLYSLKTRTLQRCFGFPTPAPVTKYVGLDSEGDLLVDPYTGVAFPIVAEHPEETYQIRFYATQEINSIESRGFNFGVSIKNWEAFNITVDRTGDYAVPGGIGNIYLIGFGFTQPTLIYSGAGTSPTYSLADLETIEGGRILTSNEDYNINPNSTSSLSYHKGRLFYNKGNTLYFSKSDKLFSFPAENFILSDSKITHIKSLIDRLILFHPDSISILYGSSEEDFYVRLNVANSGTKFPKVLNYKNALVYVSYEGVMLFDGYRDYNLTLEHLGRVDLNEIVDWALVGDLIYWIYGDFIYRAKFSGNKITKITKITNDENIVNFNFLDLKLRGYSANGNKFELFNGDDRKPFYFKSADFVEGGLTYQKIYNNFYISSEGEVNFKLNIDDNMFNFDLASSSPYVEDLKPPQSFKRGYKVNLELSGTGVVREVGFRSLLRKVDMG